MKNILIETVIPLILSVLVISTAIALMVGMFRYSWITSSYYGDEWLHDRQEWNNTCQNLVRTKPEAELPYYCLMK